MNEAEHAERVESAYQAGTLAELAALHADLTVSGPGHLGMTSKVTAVFSGARRAGRWVLHARTIASAIFGRVTLDLREALVPEQPNVIVAHGLFGKVTVRVPPGVLVSDEGISFLGSRNTVGRARNVSLGPDTPTIELRVIPLLGEVTVDYSD